MAARNDLHGVPRSEIVASWGNCDEHERLQCVQTAPNPTGRANLAITFQWEAPIYEWIAQFDLCCVVDQSTAGDHVTSGGDARPAALPVVGGLLAGGRCAGMCRGRETPRGGERHPLIRSRDPINHRST